VAERLLEVFSDPVGLFAGAETVGDRLMVLPVLFHLLWRHLLLVELDRELLSPRSVVQVTGRCAG
jgi:hypothetical protein